MNSAKVNRYLDGRVALHLGDCLDVMAGLPEASIDSVVCDPPYHLTSINKRYSSADSMKTNHPIYGRHARGFMGKGWDGGDIAFRPETWAAVWRVLKPGGHLVAFSGTRTYHRMVVAIEDAGFEVRDMLCWHYGSGFPKSHNVSKGIDKAAGAERERIRPVAIPRRERDGTYALGGGWQEEPFITAPATDAAKQWDGWGSALKPATEPIVLARKPLIGTIVENVLEHGTGALNIDGCRIGTNGGTKGCDAGPSNGILGDGLNGSFGVPVPGLGRWPANLLHDGSPEVMALFPDALGGISVERNRDGEVHNQIYGAYRKPPGEDQGYGDSGSAARFFYTSKAAQTDRLGSKHPTVKPLDLMQWLVRLVTPRGGIVLDPFAGTGTTGEAAWREGCSAVLIEREAEYQADIARRMELAAMPTKRAAVAATKNKLDDPNELPLFAMAG